MKSLLSFEINNIPIRYKIITLLLLISILPSIALGSLISLTVSKIIDNQVTDHTLQLIGQANKSLESSVENLQNISYLISFDPAIENFLYENESIEDSEAIDDYQMRQFLKGFTTVYPEIAGILVVNSDGEYISNEIYPRSVKSLLNENWYKEALINKGIFEIIGHPSERNITNHVHYKDSEIVSGVRAILDSETQEVKGVILIDLKLRNISETIENVRPGKSGFLMVIDDEGDTIYSPNSQLLNHINPDWFEGEMSGTFSKGVNGTELQFIYLKSAFTNWTTIGVFSTSDSIIEVQEIKFYVVSFLFVVCLLGIGLSYYLSYSMSRPIGQLISIMNKAETGDLSVRYDGHRQDEIGWLGRSFNTMLAQINRLISLTELQERQKREAELRVLQAHIKPHFLYNTLDTINWMARKKGADDVAEVVNSLSRLFRIGLSKGKDMIQLNEEIEHIHSYLKIQSARYKNKLNYSIQVDPEIEKASVIKLVLQPIVENAIYHGIKERRGPGNISINAMEQNGNIIIKVLDDGVGIPMERLDLLRENLAADFHATDETKKIGYGVMNVQARIKLTFGDPYGIHVESEVSKGTIVTILLPILKSDS